MSEQQPTPPKMPPLWVMKTRAPFFTAMIVPIFLGALVAWAREGALNLFYFVLTMAGGVALLAGANMLNDYFDHYFGTDEANKDFVSPFTGGSRLIQMGLVPAKTFLREGLLYLVIGSAIGLFLAATRSWSLLWIGAIGLFSAYFYTAPPLRLVATGLGDLFIGLNFGVLATLGAYAVQTRTLAWEPVIASLPVALLIASVLFINQFQDTPSDAATGKRHTVVRLGRKRAVSGYILLMGATYLALVLGVVLDGVTPFALVGLLTIPLAWQAIQVARVHYDHPQELAPANATTIRNHLLTGVLVTGGYLAQALVTLW